jgi:glycosyltransferase involved in cell wall biosynthesis
MLRQHAGFALDRTGLYYQRNQATLGRWVLRNLRNANALIGFIRNIDPGLCAACQQRGLRTVADQMIAPAAVEIFEMDRQVATWPGWQSGYSKSRLDRVADYERRTWEHLDHVTCPSDYVRDSVIAQGVDSERASVLHYPIDDVSFPFIDRRGRTGPMTVGFVGEVGLRKGAPYFFEVARRFDPTRVRFVMLGPVTLDASKVAAHRGPVELPGNLPRSSVSGWLERFDVFFFPTTCEGSAYALMEAMSSGLPVVTTPNSGTIARHGEEGLIADFCQTDTFTEYLTQLREDPEFRWKMGAAARRRYESVNLDQYSRGLHALFTRLLSSGKR